MKWSGRVGPSGILGFQVQLPDAGSYSTVPANPAAVPLLNANRYPFCATHTATCFAIMTQASTLVGGNAVVSVARNGVTVPGAVSPAPAVGGKITVDFPDATFAPGDDVMVRVAFPDVLGGFIDLNVVVEFKGPIGATGPTGPFGGPPGPVGPTGPGPSMFQYETFPLVSVTSVLDSEFNVDVVPETAPIVIPAGWRVVVRATVPLQAVSASDPTPVPPGGEVYGGLSSVQVRQDPTGADVQVASTVNQLSFMPLSPDGVEVSWSGGATFVAVSEFISDGAAHTYKVLLRSPRFVGASQSVFANPPVLDTRLGLELFATPPA